VFSDNVLQNYDLNRVNIFDETQVPIIKLFTMIYSILLTLLSERIGGFCRNV